MNKVTELLQTLTKINSKFDLDQHLNADQEIQSFLSTKTTETVSLFKILFHLQYLFTEEITIPTQLSKSQYIKQGLLMDLFNRVLFQETTKNEENRTDILETSDNVSVTKSEESSLKKKNRKILECTISELRYIATNPKALPFILGEDGITRIDYENVSPDISVPQRRPLRLRNYISTLHTIRDGTQNNSPSLGGEESPKNFDLTQLPQLNYLLEDNEHENVKIFEKNPEEQKTNLSSLKNIKNHSSKHVKFIIDSKDGKEEKTEKDFISELEEPSHWEELRKAIDRLKLDPTGQKNRNKITTEAYERFLQTSKTPEFKSVQKVLEDNKFTITEPFIDLVVREFVSFWALRTPLMNPIEEEIRLAKGSHPYSESRGTQLHLQLEHLIKEYKISIGRKFDLKSFLTFMLRWAEESETTSVSHPFQEVQIRNLLKYLRSECDTFVACEATFKSHNYAEAKSDGHRGASDSMRIDLLFADENGALVPLDYKTGVSRLWSAYQVCKQAYWARYLLPKLYNIESYFDRNKKVFQAKYIDFLFLDVSEVRRVWLENVKETHDRVEYKYSQISMETGVTTCIGTTGLYFKHGSWRPLTDRLDEYYNSPLSFENEEDL